jgi:hypothetical protein
MVNAIDRTPVVEQKISGIAPIYYALYIGSTVGEPATEFLDHPVIVVRDRDVVHPCPANFVQAPGSGLFVSVYTVKHFGIVLSVALKLG